MILQNLWSLFLYDEASSLHPLIKRGENGMGNKYDLHVYTISQHELCLLSHLKGVSSSRALTMPPAFKFPKKKLSICDCLLNKKRTLQSQECIHLKYLHVTF